MAREHRQNAIQCLNDSNIQYLVINAITLYFPVTFSKSLSILVKISIFILPNLTGVASWFGSHKICREVYCMVVTTEGYQSASVCAME